MFISIALSIITGIFSIRNLYLCSPYYEKNYIQLCSWIFIFLRERTGGNRDHETKVNARCEWKNYFKRRT